MFINYGNCNQIIIAIYPIGIKHIYIPLHVIGSWFACSRQNESLV